MKIGIHVVVAATFFISLSAIADDDVKEESEDESERVCIDSRLVDNFDGLTDKHVFVEERRNQYYLLTMKHRCFGLRNAHTIGLKDTTNRICSNRVGGEVIFRDMGSGVRKCFIDTIVPAENKDAARAIVDEQEQHDKHQKKEKEKD
jgi:hypothetical protein